MGQKESKPKGRNPRSPGSSGTSPLNNATYWEAEEDPDWDSCVMVVATQKGRSYPTLRPTCSNDSLAKSLAKEVDYSPVNVSRRSPDFSIISSPMAPLAPDSRYPTPGQRKRQNTLVDTGWHACFKNNNYVFIRNGSSGITGSDQQQYGDKWKQSENDVTFVITTSNPVDSGKEEKLIVSLNDPKPKITRYSPPPVCEDTPKEKGQNPRELNSTGSRKSVNRKKSTNWLKKLRTPGKNRTPKDGTGEEATLITGSNTDESPESIDSSPPAQKMKVEEISPPNKPSPATSLPTTGFPHQNSPIKDMTPVSGSREDLLDNGPQTSTPKGRPDSDLQVLRRNGTPYRPLDTRLSVRRRLPYDEMSPDVNPKTPVFSPQQRVLLNAFAEDSHQTSPKLDMPLSPIKKVSPYSGSKNSLSEEPPRNLQRTFSCFSPTPQTSREDEKSKSSASLQRSSSTVLSDYLSKAMEESIESEILRNSIEKLGGGESHAKKPENRLHPSNSNTDIPYADSEEDVSFDDRRTRRIMKQREAKLVDVPSFKDSAVKQETGSLPLLKSPNIVMMTPAQKTISTSEPVISLNETCHFEAVPMSPMEEEENTSLNQRPAKILLSPDDSTVTFSPLTPAKRPSLDSPISCWLREIRLLTDNECLNALQAKELLKEDWIPNALAVGNAQETSEKIWEVGNTVNEHVEEMLEILKSDKPTSVPLSLKVAQFCSSIIELLKMTNAIKQVSQAEAKIRQACSELLLNVNKGDNGNRKAWKDKIKAELEGLQKVSHAIVQQMLMKELHVIVNCVEKAENINNLKRSVFAIILLGRLHSTFCEIMTKLGAVRSLLSICVETKWREMHPCVLRGLTVLSSVPSAIRNFEDSGGVDCVCDVLCDDNVQEGARSEAAGLVAQITAPWTEGSGYVLRSVTTNSDRLVKALASLASTTENSEVFLLSSAALANLSFADVALKKMKVHNVLDILVTACQNKSHAASLFIKDQVATVLANMAAKEEFREDLSRPGGSLSLLLGLLQLRPTGRAEPQLAACERSQQKAAIALARLCSDPHTSNVVAEMQGIQRLVKLCKDRRERNDSDSVLVACLAALRKIAAVRQKEEFAKLGAQELVEPRLWDAFLAHSSKGESYV